MKDLDNFWVNYLKNDNDLIESCKLLQNIQAKILAAYEILQGHVRIRNIPSIEYSLAEMIDEFFNSINISQDRNVKYQELMNQLETYENKNSTYNVLPSSVSLQLKYKI